ncbi:hypothetical protein ACQEVB_06645 [Pseudonocardia sp. CA-107938]|uniref:hypothetical protein n=1 Tax=Pseudonocardia sp. CA-107938 TaxID=3240021 RepID=UPI003D8DD02A
MPIRTPHGRAAAYRAIWQWPLRSPGRLAVTAVVAAAIVAGVSFGIGALQPERSGPMTGPRATPTARAVPPGQTPLTPAPTALPPVAPLTPTELPVSAAPPAAVELAQRWTRAWVRPPQGTTAQQWLDGLRPMTTPEYLGVLSSVDPSNIPATRVTGSAHAVSVSPQSVRVQVPTDALTLVVVVVDDAGTWRVADYDEA